MNQRALRLKSPYETKKLTATTIPMMIVIN